MKTLSVQTRKRSEMVVITDRVQEVVTESAVVDGKCTVYCPHTTAAITINENADPDVASDILDFADRLVPQRTDYFEHTEGNSDSHIKACFFGASETVVVKNGQLVLGTWQGIFFCEFDGPRSRSVHVSVSE